MKEYKYSGMLICFSVGLIIIKSSGLYELHFTGLDLVAIVIGVIITLILIVLHFNLYSAVARGVVVGAYINALLILVNIVTIIAEASGAFTILMISVVSIVYGLLVLKEFGIFGEPEMILERRW